MSPPIGRCTSAYGCPAHPDATGIHPPTLGQPDVGDALRRMHDYARSWHGDAPDAYWRGMLDAVRDLARELGIELPPAGDAR